MRVIFESNARGLLTVEDGGSGIRWTELGWVHFWAIYLTQKWADYLTQKWAQKRTQKCAHKWVESSAQKWVQLKASGSERYCSIQRALSERRVSLGLLADYYFKTTERSEPFISQIYTCKNPFGDDSN